MRIMLGIVMFRRHENRRELFERGGGGGGVLVFLVSVAECFCYVFLLNMTLCSTHSCVRVVPHCGRSAIEPWFVYTYNLRL